MYIVRFTYNEQVVYLANGASYKVDNKTYVPLTSELRYAKRYGTLLMAKKSAQRKGENLFGEAEIIEIQY